MYQDTFARSFYLGFAQTDAAGNFGMVKYGRGPWYTRIAALQDANISFCVHATNGFTGRGTASVLQDCEAINRELGVNTGMALGAFSLLVTPLRNEHITINIPASRTAPLQVLWRATSSAQDSRLSRLPKPFEAGTINATFGGMTLRPPHERVVRWANGDGRWFLEDGREFLGDPSLLLDGPVQISGSVDISGLKFVEEIVSTKLDILVNGQGRIWVLKPPAQGQGVHVGSANLWLLDPKDAKYDVKAGQIVIPCKNNNNCVFSWVTSTQSDGSNGIHLEQPGAGLAIPVDDAAGALPAIEGISAVAKQFRSVEPARDIQ